MLVYIVSVKNWDDVWIAGVFSTKEEAIEFCNGDENLFIDTWEIDGKQVECDYQ